MQVMSGNCPLGKGEGCKRTGKGVEEGQGGGSVQGETAAEQECHCLPLSPLQHTTSFDASCGTGRHELPSRAKSKPGPAFAVAALLAETWCRSFWLGSLLTHLLCK